MMLVFSLLSATHATSIDISVDQFSVYQSDTPTTNEDGEDTPATGEDGEEKKKSGEEEEPECE